MNIELYFQLNFIVSRQRNSLISGICGDWGIKCLLIHKLDSTDRLVSPEHQQTVAYLLPNEENKRIQSFLGSPLERRTRYQFSSMCTNTS